MPEEEEQGSDEEGEEMEEDEEEVEGEGEEEADEEAIDEKKEEDSAQNKSGDIGGSAKEVNTTVFQELRLRQNSIDEVKSCWDQFLRSAESREAAGEAIYAAIFDSAPSLQSLFKTPRAVMAMRFMNGLIQIMSGLETPAALKITVETLGFQHLDLEVTVPRVEIFRSAIVDLLALELGARFTAVARDGWCTMLNYVGGAYIYVRLQFAGRLKILATSWATANNKKADALAEEGLEGEEGEDGEKKDKDAALTSQDAIVDKGPQGPMNDPKAQDKQKKKETGRFANWGKKSKNKNAQGNGAGAEGEAGGDAQSGTDFKNTSVPTTFNEMFRFNAAVMGFSHSNWMEEVLASFDTIVTNVANSFRLQEECDTLSLRIAKYKGTINLSEYKAVMLASLRSLVPKDWDSEHEVAWGWLWDNVERMMRALMGKPQVQEKALERLWSSLDEISTAAFRRDVYATFFALAPAGQDYFKQSTTRLHFIADRIVAMTLDLYKNPKKMVEDISALGLRHVGYGIPTELFGPFVTGCVQVVRGLTKEMKLRVCSKGHVLSEFRTPEPGWTCSDCKNAFEKDTKLFGCRLCNYDRCTECDRHTVSDQRQDEVAEEAFRWSLSLISRILTRVINEGSTIVMKAINTNSGKAVKKAVSCAPRGKRALWVLNITVGTQSISPLLWAIETGSIEAARAMITDLLIIRADRDRYYYGMDTLFERHPDIVQRLCNEAPALLSTLLDGLVWRSRTTENGLRRVNYYVKHLMVDSSGGFAKAIEWLTDNKDPKIICHPVIALVLDVVWSRVAFRTFLYGKSWFGFILLVFIASQSILNHMPVNHDGHLEVAYRVAITACRVFIYMFSMTQWVYFHLKNTFADVRNEEIEKVMGLPVPRYLCNWQDFASFLLTVALVTMLCLEPIIHCYDSNQNDHILSDICDSASATKDAYSIFSTCAMLLYYLILIDLSVFSTRISAFVLVFARVLSEVGLFLFGLAFFIMTFSCAVSTLDHPIDDFSGIHKAAVSFLKITFGMYEGRDFKATHDEPALLVPIFIYVVLTSIFLLNLLIAQLNCSYQTTFQDMLGFARLNRGKIVVEAMATVSHRRWEKFIASLRLDERCEFGEGDIGLAGGIQVTEPSNANITTVDMIRRFGGSTSPAAQWPEEDAAGDDEEDAFDRIERTMQKAMKRMSSGKGGKTSGGGNSTSGSMGQSHSDKGGSGSHGDSGDDHVSDD